MIKLGLTGGLGSGKSTAADFFRSKGAYIFDADYEAKNLLHQSKFVKNKIITAYGPQVQTAAGNLDLSKLAEFAFSNKERQEQLNKIVWPEVYHLISKACQNALTAKSKLFVVDAALLIEANFIEFFDMILLITAPVMKRVDRAKKRTNISRKQLIQRINLQSSDDEKKIHCQYVIENNDTVNRFLKNLEIFYFRLGL